MGKKSKKKAAKAPPLEGSSTAGNAVGAGGTVSVGRKNARCVFCSGTVKTSEGKGHRCPGCSNICCYRCEKKQFLECPNGKECVHPMRRCPRCVVGLSLLSEMGIDPKQSNESYSPKDIFRMYAERGGDLHRASVPFGVCHDCGEDYTIECFHCVSSSEISRLLLCKQCKLLKCGACLDKSTAAVDRSLLSASIDGSRIDDSELCAAAEERLVREVPTSTIVCNACSELTCVACLAGNGLERFIKGCLNNIPFSCDTCYYTKKPCTNPTCPNKIGIPTKRCGGCHISRYCSKECQAADYPAHKAKCERMQEKLASKNSRVSKM